MKVLHDPHKIQNQHKNPHALLFAFPHFAMRNCSILPLHSHFARLLSRLRLVVVDEGHAYHGVFGASMCGMGGQVKTAMGI